FSRRRRHTRFSRDWSSDMCSSDLHITIIAATEGMQFDRVDPGLIENMYRIMIDPHITIAELPEVRGVAGGILGEFHRERYATSEIGRASCRETVQVGEGAVVGRRR